jgi:hypothetical protein
MDQEKVSSLVVSSLAVVSSLVVVVVCWSLTVAFRTSVCDGDGVWW